MTVCFLVVAAGLCIWEVITAKISSEKVEARFAKIDGMIFLQRCVLKNKRCSFLYRGVF